MSLTPQGLVRDHLEAPYPDGTKHVVFEPLDFIARLAALVTCARVNLTRYHGMFAPNSQQQGQITSSKRRKQATTHNAKIGIERRAVTTGTHRLKRVLHIDIEACTERGRVLNVIASIEDPVVIEKIGAHLLAKEPQPFVELQPQSWAPPSLFD